MKILVFGAGVIGTIYGWAFAQKGHSVTLYVRPRREPFWNGGGRLHLLDERTPKQEIHTHFQPSITSTLSAEDSYDLILVTVKHTQAEEALRQIAPHRGNALVLLFHNQWRSLDYIDGHLPKTAYVLGMPRAGGSMFYPLIPPVIHTEVTVTGGLHKEVILGTSLCGKPNPPEVQALCDANLAKVANLFQEAGFYPKIQANMEHWYWVHFASTTAWIAGACQARGFIPFSKNTALIKEALRAGKEAMEICKARGVDVMKVEDARPFLLPVWLSGWVTKRFLQTPMAKRISEGHGYYAPHELIQIYEDVVQTAQQYHVNIPHLLGLQSAVRELTSIREND